MKYSHVQGICAVCGMEKSRCWEKRDEDEHFDRKHRPDVTLAGSVIPFDELQRSGVPAPSSGTAFDMVRWWQERMSGIPGANFDDALMGMMHIGKEWRPLFGHGAPPVTIYA